MLTHLLLIARRYIAAREFEEANPAFQRGGRRAVNTALGLVFIVTLVMGVPVAFTMLIASLAAVLVQGSFDPMVAVQSLFAGIDSFPLLAIPFFILAAELMSGGALTEVLLRFASRLVGHVRGGLGHTNILTLTFFSGISGSALADARPG